MSRWRVLFLALIMLVVLAQPVLADAPHGGRVLFGQDFRLRADERLDGDLVSFGGDVVLEAGSRVRGNVVAFGGSVEAAGEVDGSVFSFGGEVTLRSGAVVIGDVVSPNGVQQDEGAVIRGQLVSGTRGRQVIPFVDIDRRGTPCTVGLPFWPGGGLGDLFFGFWRAALGALAVVALAILVVLLIPGPTRTVSEAVVAYPGPSIGVGLLTGLAAILVVPLLVITCIGIPLAVLAVVALAIAGLFGWIAAGLALGERVLVALRQADRQPLVAAAVGALLLTFLGNLPCLGFLVGILVGAWGLGAVLLTRFGTTPYTGAPSPRVTPPPALPGPPNAGDGSAGPA